MTAAAAAIRSKILRFMGVPIPAGMAGTVRLSECLPERPNKRKSRCGESPPMQRNPPSATPKEVLVGGAYAARSRSTYCRMPPFLKYSSSSIVSMRQRIGTFFTVPSP
jgi:hypothetical protein